MFTLNREDGFSTVELLITLVVIGLVFITFSELNVNTRNIINSGDDASSASEAANRIIQHYENLSCASGTPSVEDCLPNTTAPNHITINRNNTPVNTAPFNQTQYYELLGTLGVNSRARVIITNQDVTYNAGVPATGLLKKVRVEVYYGTAGNTKVVKSTLIGLQSEGGSH